MHVKDGAARKQHEGDCEELVETGKPGEEHELKATGEGVLGGRENQQL